MFRKSFTSFFSGLIGRPKSSRCFTTKVRRPRGFRPRIEPLEDRRLLAVALVEDVHPGEESSFPEPVGVVDDSLYYFASHPTHGRSLWRTDAGRQGATFVQKGGLLFGSVNVDETLFFSYGGPDEFIEIWKADGTSNSPTMLTKLKRAGRLFQIPMVAVNGAMFFLHFESSETARLWKSDGTPDGTVMVRELDPGHISHDTNWPIIAVADTLFFRAGDRALWKSDGTAASTRIVHDAGGIIDNFTVLNDTLYYTVSSGSRVGTLWRSDGTKEGTRPIKEGVYFSARRATASAVVNVDGELFFAAGDGVHGVELWKSDGTIEGTVLVKDINPGGEGWAPASLINAAGVLFFIGDDGVSGRQLWKSDGTESGTHLTVEFPTISDQAPVHSPFSAGGTVLFSFDEKIWRTDGTAAGTGPVVDLALLPSYFGGPPFRPSFTNVNGTVYFTADDGVHGGELWKIFRLPGDTNYDDRVDLADLNNVRNGFGRSGDSPRGDANGDGVVDLVDLNLVRNGFEPARARPLTKDDAYQVDEDMELVVNAAEGLLANDAAEPGRTVQAIIQEAPRHGTVQIEPDGSFRYRPHRDFFGGDSFQYVVVAGSGSPSQLVDVSRSWPAAVRITVAPVPDAPRANDFTVEVVAGEVFDSRRIDPTREAEPNDSIGAAQRIDAYFTLGLDPDIADSTTTPHATILGSGDGTSDFYRFRAPSQGSLLFDIDTAPGESLDTYLRLYDANGVLLRDADDSPIETGAGGSHSTRDAFLSYFFDGGFDPFAEFIIEVGACCMGPVPQGANYRLHVSVPGHTVVTAGMVTNAFDADGDSLRAIVVFGVARGELSYTADGAFTYTPSAGFVGVDSFNYRVSDGSVESSTFTVRIVVHPAPARGLDRLQGVSRSFGRKTASTVEPDAVWDQALAELALI